MRKLLTSCIAVASVCIAVCHPAQAQIQNGDFETRNHDPRGAGNIKGARTSVYDDLPSWSGISENYLGPDYLASPAIVSRMDPRLTPPYGWFNPRNNSNGCVGITKEPYSSAGYQFITQQVTLKSGYTYRAKFYVLRRPGAIYQEKLTLYVTEGGKPNYTWVPSLQTHRLSPTPYAKVVSDPIVDNQNWTEVSGTFVAHGNTPGAAVTASITIGFDETQVPPQPGLYSEGNGTYYIIDDVEVSECLTCCPSASGSYTTLDVESEYGSQVPSPTGEDNYCFSQRLTFSAPLGPQTATYQWVVNGYNVQNGNEVQGYTVNGNSMSFIPTTTSPGISRYVTVTCITNYGPSCSASQSSKSFFVSSQNEEGTPCTQYRAEPVQSTFAYPNPAGDYLTFPENTTGITIKDQEGKTVGIKKSLLANGRLDTRLLPEGLYQLRMVVSGKVVSQRIQIKH
ncbi:T9SS type A sorting domain-containing protein [Hymenobacter cellulosilyticus]|uniref:T9SS type A sorting domain-containing protein n=1 Tax=Hymenobacter cellulosilyticus TaxID=2932248 RepID=A0A8T9Q7H6_9BACT|nr:T9SS type A sorting domain-containing protein [Hymenobacter cellulosilyticus]UOQ70973.1 T9SS type A sorting domain-containing protein [Hymenobacter cellulosilyticus]